MILSVLQLGNMASLPFHDQLRTIFNIMITGFTVSTLRMRTFSLIVPRYPTCITLDGFPTSATSSTKASTAAPKASTKSSSGSSLLELRLSQLLLWKLLLNILRSLWLTILWSLHLAILWLYNYLWLWHKLRLTYELRLRLHRDKL